MTHTDYITTKKQFAWHPVKTENAGWVWWKTVEKTRDERPEVYLGLLPITTYMVTLSK